VVTDEPVPPARLNARVSRDLQTICLKCLQKDPGKRYATSADLAADLGRFLRHEPIQARPAGWMERLVRWVRRNPAATSALAAAVVLLASASGGGMWFVQQRVEQRAEAARRDGELHNEVGTAVAQAEGLRRGFHFREARELLKQARLKVEPEGPQDLRGQLRQARSDLDLVERLDAARIQGAMIVEGKLDPASAEPLYESAFADTGLGRHGDDCEEVAARVRASSVCAEIVAALDDWASITQYRSRREWLLTVAQKADSAPARNRFRQPDLWQDRDKLKQLAQEPDVAALSPQLATALARVSLESKIEATALLTAAQAHYPQDFWVNLELAAALYQANRLDEAVSYCRAALALRPNISAAHNMLGVTLRALGRVDEAIDHLQQAVQIDPNYAVAHYNLGAAVRDKGRGDEAARHFERALSIDPKIARAHSSLGAALLMQGRRDEAIGQFEQALSIDPKLAPAHYNLGVALRARGQTDEAIDQFQKVLRLDPKHAQAHIILGNAMYAKGRFADAIHHFQQALSIDAKAPVQSALGDSLYATARADVQTAAGQPSDKGRRGEAERAGLRRQALDQLRATLDLKIKMRNDGKMLDWSFSTWQTDPALISVRDPAELAKLPDAERDDWQRFWAEVAALPAADPLEQGRAAAARRQWTAAAAGYARTLARGPTDDGHFWLEYAALLSLSGDRPGYAKACAHMAARCGKPGGPRAYHLARACTLAADAVADAGVPGHLAETELRANAREFWSLTEQGALAYRAGRFQEAMPLFEKSLKADAKPGRAVVNWLWLALANHRLGKSEEARRWLGKAQAWLDQFDDGMPASADTEFGLHLHNWLEAHVLRREAEGLFQSANP
jgi:tetratricopeptide (TPR) repeat protein